MDDYEFSTLFASTPKTPPVSHPAPASISAWHASARARWGAVGALLVGEYLLVSFRFDAQPLLEAEGSWATLGLLGSAAPLAMAVATSILLFGGADLRARLDELTQVTAQRPWVAMGLHALCFSGAWYLTTHLFSGALPQRGHPALWLAAWLALAAATALTALSIVCSPRALAAFGRPLLGAGLAGGAVGLAAWGAGLASAALWIPLSDATLRTVEHLLRPLISSVVVDYPSRIVGTPTFAVEIAPICSGYEGIGLITVFLSVYLWSARRSLRFPHALAILPVGIAAMWFGNAARIAALIAVGSWGAPSIAHGGFHSKAGWLSFCVLALTIIALAPRVAMFQAPDSGSGGPPPSVSATRRTSLGTGMVEVYLLPLLAVLATALVTGLATADFDYLYPLRVVAAVTVLCWYRRQLVSVLTWSWSWFPVLIGTTAYVAWRLLEPIPDPSATANWERALATMPFPLWVGWLSLRTVGTVITVPLMEELAFRGYLLRRLVSRDFLEVDAARFYPFAAVVSSVAFGALHQRWLAGTMAGLLYAYAYCRRGQLVDATIAHSVTNAILAGEVLFTQRWWLWQ